MTDMSHAMQVFPLIRGVEILLVVLRCLQGKRAEMALVEYMRGSRGWGSG
jgi:hypothetical protein